MFAISADPTLAWNCEKVLNTLVSINVHKTSTIYRIGSCSAGLPEGAKSPRPSCKHQVVA